jgi:hypothetical protein
VQEGLAEAVAVALDAAVFSGIAKPATWPDSIMGAATTAGNVVSAGTATVPQGVVGDTSRPPWTPTWMASPAGPARDLQGAPISSRPVLGFAGRKFEAFRIVRALRVR